MLRWRHTVPEYLGDAAHKTVTGQKYDQQITVWLCWWKCICVFASLLHVFQAPYPCSIAVGWVFNKCALTWGYTTSKLVTSCPGIYGLDSKSRSNDLVTQTCAVLIFYLCMCAVLVEARRESEIHRSQSSGVVSCPVWALEAKLGSFTRAANAVPYALQSHVGLLIIHLCGVTRIWQGGTGWMGWVWWDDDVYTREGMRELRVKESEK